MKTVKIVLIFLLTLTAAGVTGIWVYSHDKTFYNDVNEIGNSSGNLYNGGLFCEQEKFIYFSNDKDNGSLYIMNSNCSQFKKVHQDKAVYINADGNYIYYVRANNTRENSSNNFFVFNNTGIYRIRQNGSDLKCVSRMPGAYLLLSGNTLFYQGYTIDTGLYLYSNTIDCSKEKVLIKDKVAPASVIDNILYYTGNAKDHNINYVNLRSFTEKTKVRGNFAFPVFFHDYIYYMDMNDNYKIYRMDMDGSNPTPLVNERCSTYNITNSGKYLYYQTDGGKDNHICRLDLETGKSETISKGIFKQIHVTSNYVFFKDLDNTNSYVLSADGSSKVRRFDAPNLSARK